MIKQLNAFLFSGLFEYSAVLAFFGLGILCLQKKSRKTGIVIAVCFFIPVAVLLLAGHYTSKRYIAINIVPSLFLAGAFIFSAFLKKCQFHFLLFLITLIVFLAKDLHTDSYSDYRIRASELLKKDASSKSRVMLINCTKESGQIQYYSGIPCTDFSQQEYVFDSMKKIKDSVFRTINVNSADTTVYLLLKTKCTAPKIRAEEVGLSGNEWNLLGAFPVNRKKENELRLYRAERKASTPQHFFDQQLLNGDFESAPVMNGFALSSLKILQENGCDFFKRPGIVLPAGWRIILARSLRNVPFEVEQTSIDTIAGKGSLRMSAKQLKTSLIRIQSEQKIPIRHGYLEFGMQAKALIPRTSLRVNVCIYKDADSKFLAEEPLLHLDLNDTAIHDYRIILPGELQNRYADQNCYLLLTLDLGRGEILLDNFKMYSEKKHENTVD